MDISAIAGAARAAQAAQVGWARLSLERRGEHLEEIGRRFAARGEEVVRVVCEETKKSEGDAWFADVVPNLDLFDWWTGKGLDAIKPQKAPISKLKFPGKRATLSYEPRGVVGLISPWNYPAALPLRTLVPALMAGNAVLFKPSEVTPRTGALLVEIFNSVLPAGLLALVEGAGDAGEAVIDAADHVVFTGSVATGRKVALRCAAQLKTVSLELGGKDAAIVLADCDLDRTAQGIFWAGCSNSGQNCAAVERVYAERPVYDRLVAALAGLAARAEVAPVATAAQDAIVRRHLEDALARGAKAHGTYPGAVILTDVPDDAEVMTEETFGPLIPVVPVADAEEALARANGTRFGLTTSIWTTDIAAGEALAARAESGVVTLNNASFTAAMPFAPWSGRGESGHGVTNSHLAILELVQPKFVLVDQNKAPEAWWFPLSADALTLARDTLDWLTAKGTAKLTRTVGVLRGMKRRVNEQKSWFRG